MDIKIYDSAKKELDNLISAAADNKKYIRNENDNGKEIYSCS